MLYVPAETNGKGVGDEARNMTIMRDAVEIREECEGQDGGGIVLQASDQ